LRTLVTETETAPEEEGEPSSERFKEFFERA
jgi:hypothetical protein